MECDSFKVCFYEINKRIHWELGSILRSEWINGMEIAIDTRGHNDYKIYTFLLYRSGFCIEIEPIGEMNIEVLCISSVQFSSVQSLSRVRLFAIPWIAARQASLSITISRSSLRLTSIESVMPSSHLILGRPLLLLPLIPPSIRVFSNESTLRMRWPKYWSLSFSIIPSKEIPGLISFRMDWMGIYMQIL